MWLSGLSASLWTKGSQVWFPVGAHAWVVGHVGPPVGGMREATTHWCFSPSLSPTLPHSLKINKYIFLNADLLSYSSRGQKSKIGLTGLKFRRQQSRVPSAGSRREICFWLFSASPCFSGMPMFVGLWPPSLQSLLLWSSCLPLSLIRTLVITLGRLGSSRIISSSPLLNHICKPSFAP